MDTFFNWIKNKKDSNLAPEQEKEFKELEQIWNTSSELMDIKVPDTSEE